MVGGSGAGCVLLLGLTWVGALMPGSLARFYKQFDGVCGRSTMHTAQTARQSFQEGSYFFLLGQLPYLETTTQNNTEFTELPRKSYDLPTDFRLNPASRFFPHTRKQAPTLLGPAQLS